ncbi:MAG: tRNA nucleotidyltransferase (CCA-adding enzyme) [Kiritimatiellia bacterium]|jgi:tRNA nucleotidyltransferase (CCA-adding enzyme)
MRDSPSIPPLVLTLAERCNELGGTAYLVGGVVRDHFLGQPLKDYDIEVFGIEPRPLERMLRKLGRVNTVGKAFGVFKLQAGSDELDISLPRRDSKRGPGHRGIHVEGDPFMSVHDAVKRRDLTINALMWDLNKGQLLDPTGGMQDLEARRLRAVDDATFLEDPLRAVRVVQFAARFKFTADAQLIGLCERAALHELPAERIREEWVKLMLRGARPSMGLAVARASGMLQRMFPDLRDDPACDVALDWMAQRSEPHTPGRRLTSMMLSWLWTQPDPTPTLDRLGLHRWLSYPSRKRLLDAHANRGQRPLDDAALRHLSTRCELQLLFTCQAAHGDLDAPTRLQAAQQLNVHHEQPEPILKGRHLKSLGISPGPIMGQVLHAIYVLQLDGSITDLDQARIAAQRHVQNAD